MAPVLKQKKNFEDSISYCDGIKAQMVVTRNQQELDAFRTYKEENGAKEGACKT